MDVFLLQHSYERYGEEDTKIIGIYSSEIEARAAIVRIKVQPGFRDHPESFHIDRYGVDEDNWRGRLCHNLARSVTGQIRNRSEEVKLSPRRSPPSKSCAANKPLIAAPLFTRHGRAVDGRAERGADVMHAVPRREFCANGTADAFRRVDDKGGRDVGSWTGTS